MTTPIVAEVTPMDQSPQTPVGAVLVEQHYAEQIAELIARHRLRRPTLDLREDLTLDERRDYVRLALLALRAGDPAHDLPATYLAADAMIAITGAGPLLGSLPRQRRTTKVEIATAGLRTYRRALAGELPGQMRVLGLLALADLQEQAHDERRSAARS